MKHNNITSVLRGGRTRVVFGLVAVTLLAGAIAVASAHPHKHKRGRTIELHTGAFLGVQMQELTDELRDGLDIKVEKGILINEVIDDSPADEAGLHDGDVIVAFNGKDVESPRQLRDLIAERKSGDTVKIDVIRDDREKSFDVTIGEWPNDGMAFVAPHSFDIDVPGIVADFHPRRLGVQVSELNEDLASYFGVKKDGGLLVLSVSDESTAAEAGVKSGDVITKVGDEDVTSTKDIRSALSDMDEGDKVAIEVVRKKRKKSLEGEVKGASFDWQSSGFWRGHAPRAPHGGHGREIIIERDDDLREEIDELRKELDELRKELKK